MRAQKAAKRVALFIVKGNSVSGWKAKGLTVEGVDINASSSKGASIFNDVLVKKAYYRVLYSMSRAMKSL